MIAVIDCGTTFTRLSIVDASGRVACQGKKKVGVRDTSITGSRDTLRNGLCALFDEVLAGGGLSRERVAFAVSSGMITSEIGLMEIPHLAAPVSAEDLAAGIVPVEDPAVVPLGVPMLFIPGVRNATAGGWDLSSIGEADFMRGEEVQCMGIATGGPLPPPLNLVVLSSHTKIIRIDAEKRILGCITTLSGQLYEALLTATFIGKSLAGGDGRDAGGQGDAEIIAAAERSVERTGIVRSLFMPRLLEVLLKTSGRERRVFVDAAIAADDMRAFGEFASRGYAADNYLLFGHADRCDIYAGMLRRRFPGAVVAAIGDEEELNAMTTAGVLEVLRRAGRI